MSMLHIFGDSYSTPDYYVDPKDSWWGRLSTDMQLPCKVYAWPGNNMDYITHAIVCYMNEKIHAGDYVVVGIPPVQRTTLMKPEIDKVECIQHFDLNFKCIHEEHDVLSQQGLVSIPVHDMSKDFVLGHNDEWANAQVIRNIVLLDTFLKAHDIPVMFVNTSEPIKHDEWAPMSMLSKYSQGDHIELTNTYYSVNYDVNIPKDFDKWGWVGHYGSDGNQLWYDTVIKPMTTKLGWIN